MKGRKRLQVALALMLLIGVMLALTVEVKAFEGEGTSANPYKIKSAEDLETFRDIVNGSNGKARNKAACATLEDEIVLSGTWTPIGSDDNARYTGTFDGNNHQITGLTTNGSNQGLFGSVGSSGVVRRLKVNGTINSGEHVGGIAGLNWGTIEDCTFAGFVKGIRAGGIVGENYGKIQNCKNEGNVDGTGVYTGGIAGATSVTGNKIENCVNTGTISGQGYTGGITGGGFSASISGCQNQGKVSGTSPVGGITGFVTSFTLSNCSNTGEVTGTIADIGGIAGLATTAGRMISNCTNTGKVNGPLCVGGICGFVDTGVHIVNSGNTGSVTGNTNAGGISGYLNGSIENCAMAVIDGEGASAINGDNDGNGTLASSYILSVSSGGNGKVTAAVAVTSANQVQFTLTGTPNPGIQFLNWTSGTSVVSTDNPYSLVLTADTELTLTGKAKDPGIPQPTFAGNTLVLSGRIGVNFYVNLPENPGLDYSNSYMEFEVNGKTTTVNLSESAKVSDGNYVFTCYVNSVQMADAITAKFWFSESGEKTSIEKTYSVMDYVVKSRSMGFDQKTNALIRALETYGHYAQLYLSAQNGWNLGTDHAKQKGYYAPYTDADRAEAEEKTANYGIEASTSKKISRVNYSLYLDTDTAIYLYFTPVKGYSGQPTATLNGVSVGVETLSDGRFRVAVPKIAAHRLGETYRVTLNTDGYITTVDVSAMSYVKSILASSTNQKQINMVIALYKYYAAAEAYLA